MGIGADPHHRAALLVHADQQRDSGVHSRGVLIALNGLDQSIGSFVRRIPAEEDVAAQMIGAHVGDRVCVGYPDKEQLAPGAECPLRVPGKSPLWESRRRQSGSTGRGQPAEL